ncbi:MAG: HXXEE domain-containing protein [Pseudomonadota bacterium]
MSLSTTNNRLALASAMLLFAMLWVPAGQQAFLLVHWMKLGTFAAPFILLTYFATASDRPSFANMRFMAAALTTAYIAHQFEEHWVDLFGNHYAFYSYVNDMLRAVLATQDPSIAPLTREAVFIINTSLVWLVGAMALILAEKRPFCVLALAAITLVNGLTHIIASVATGSYNPGLLTSVVIFLPLAGLFFHHSAKTHLNVKPAIIASIAWAIIAHLLMVGGMLAANLFHLMPETAYFALLVLWSLVPVLVIGNASPVTQ